MVQDKTLRRSMKIGQQTFRSPRSIPTTPNGNNARSLEKMYPSEATVLLAASITGTFSDI